LFALLLAPLWLAWGLVEVAWPGEAARFGARLICGALTVVGSVILATDPLTAAPFGKGWPLAGPHYQPPSHYALDVVQAVAVILAAASVGLAAARARTEGPWPGTLPGAAVVGLAVFLTVGLRFSLPARPAYPLFSLVAAALVWFGATRLEARPGRPARAGTERSRSISRPRAAGRDRTTGRDRTAGPEPRGRDRMVGRDETGRDRAGREAPYPANGHRGPRAPGDPRPPGDLRASGEPGRWTDPGRRPPGAPRPDWQDRPERPERPDWQERPRGAGPGPEFAPPARPELPPAPPYGRILIFTLLDDRVADFDRLAEQAAEEVRTREPDTLVYVIHLVPNAPMQRIFYEIYRDRAAFDSHENQPYMKRFVADRRACVLATNVIELRLKYAKVAPLPSPQQYGPQQYGPPQPGPPQPGPHQPGPPQPGPPQYRPPQYGPPQSLEPLPPRPDRRTPSGDPRYGGI
ncbi:MAG TPA: antibiotic biosynthesis monooxygenase, partial [Streptosporangiaceae bacterium]|nr:antibiotic biosynthesis monooxygenase [Streptosporangiaceae bacterium]